MCTVPFPERAPCTISIVNKNIKRFVIQFTGSAGYCVGLGEHLPSSLQLDL